MDSSLILGAAAVVTVWMMLTLLGGERQRQNQIKQVEAAIRAASQPVPTDSPASAGPETASQAKAARK